MSTPVWRAKAAAYAAAVQSAEKVVLTYVVPLLLSDQDAGWGAKIGLFSGGLTVIWIVPIILYWPEVSIQCTRERRSD